MAALSAIDFLNQMIAQGRVLDPSFSFEVGTPERKLLEPVAQSLADNQVDMTGLAGATDINSKFGTQLDQYVALFGMQRQQAIAATGYVVFSRPTPATTTIVIPAGVTLQSDTSAVGAPLIQFVTTSGTSIQYNATESPATPVQCVLAGTIGNVAANTIDQMVGTNVPGGVTAVTNPNALINGLDAEDDDALKVRFQNTWARNLAGTEDQFLALALAGNSTKANVLGVISKFQEYIQIPDYDDAGNLSGLNYPDQNTYGRAGYWSSALSTIPYAKQIYTNQQVFISTTNFTNYFYRTNVDFLFNVPGVMTGDVLRSAPSATVKGYMSGNPPATPGVSGSGSGSTVTAGTYKVEITYVNEFGETLPSSLASVTTTSGQNIVITSPTGTGTGANAASGWNAYVSTAGGSTLYLQQSVGSPTPIGTNLTLTANPTTSGPNPPTTNTAGATVSVLLNTGTSYQQLPEAGILWLNNQFLPYNGRSVDLGDDPSGNSVTFTLVNPPSFTPTTNAIVYEVAAYLSEAGVQPNYTFLNVSTNNAQGLTPGAVLLSEFSYVSSASRNDLGYQIDNAVDVYFDGDVPTQASTIFHSTTDNQFVTDPTSPWYYENYRRDGEPAKRPQLNNYITPLFQSPVDSLPESIVINNQTYYEGWHYWLVHEIGDLGGSIRARDGIEWNPILGGDTAAGPPTDPTKPYSPMGTSLTTLINNGTALEIDNYNYDANVAILQASMTAAAQLNTDVLAHKAKIRYFGLDVTIVYSSGASPSAVNVAIQASLQAYFQRQYFGSVIQLSTLLEVIHEVQGVDNVRWSTDFPNQPTSTRVVEMDASGNALHGASIDRLFYGTTSTPETQTLYIVGNPDGASFEIGTPLAIADNFTLTWNDTSTGTPAQFTTDIIPFWQPGTGLPVAATDISSAINNATAGLAGASASLYGAGAGITVTEDTRPVVNVDHPMRSFSITYPGNGTPVLPNVTQSVSSSDYVFNSDFYLLDNELPSLPIATVDNPLAGLTIRVRAQNTFTRAGF